MGSWEVDGLPGEVFMRMFRCEFGRTVGLGETEIVDGGMVVIESLFGVVMWIFGVGVKVVVWVKDE